MNALPFQTRRGAIPPVSRTGGWLRVSPSFFHLLGTLTFTLTLTLSPAQELLTPATLSTWTSQGGTPTVDAVQGAIAIPAGGELSRLFAPGQVAVRLVSHPFFSRELTGLPALEVGPATLTFTRDETGGALVLLGDQPLSLPFSIALDQDGRSRLPLDFTLGYDQPRATASLTLEGHTFTQATPASTAPIEVVVTAGATAAWPLDRLEIETTGEPAEGNPAANSAAGSSHASDQAKAGEDALRKRALAEAILRGEISPEEALDQLGKLDHSGKTLGARTVFALEAIELGEMLVANVRFAAAEIFFRAAEPALGEARARAVKSGEQSLCLKKLAWIRLRYLQKPKEAEADLEAAVRLNPRDKHLQQFRDRLSRDGITGQKGDSHE